MGAKPVRNSRRFFLWGRGIMGEGMGGCGLHIKWFMKMNVILIIQYTLYRGRWQSNDFGPSQNLGCLVKVGQKT